MQLSDLIAEARERTRDLSTPPSCSDARFTRFANEAEREACRRGRLLVDSTSTDICQIDITTGEASYPLDRRVLFVRKASVDSNPLFLKRISRKELDRLGSAWLSETGEVMAFVPDMDTQALRLYRVPEANDTMRLTVVRLPLDDMIADSDEPEIHERYHEKLVEWMVYRYFLTPDEEMRDPAAAQAALAAFEAEFGPPQSAVEEAWAQEHYALQDDDGNVYGG